ncbi:argininosuccinate synthase [Kibdelosporangium philippinense]|uniref:argininosuccinate synthase n=1 Tax=Kibdelosporangium philippinense TaxID=211113 RepID=A0ABS8Z6B2_9PSEU|nr:argininosuccinate synthase domain-containing protein [Kibdelosporangium philippinense]MCE7003032.1 argininosuccinate synthase [Kibdelosporangium philippinense]
MHANDNERIGLFQAGGLSSLAVGVWLTELPAPTTHYVADIGQADRSTIDELISSLRAFGAEVVLVDLRSTMAAVASDLLRCRASHDGGYWNTTGAARFVLVSELAPLMRADGCTMFAHGCVGGGNDQRRFARYGTEVAPELSIVEPWTDPQALERFPHREAMLKAVIEHKLSLDPGSSDVRSTDANLAGISHESAELEDLETPVTKLDPRWSRWPGQTAADPETVTVTFRDGLVADVNGSGSEPLEWMTEANEIGARHGIWLCDVVERRIIGTVCRGIYEAPGLELLDRAWTRLLQASLDVASRDLYDRLSVVLGAAMYEGRWLEPAACAARDAVDRLVGDISGTVTLSVHRGLAQVEGMEVAGNVVPQQTRFGSGGNRWSKVTTV